MIRKMGNFDVIQRTKDGMFNATTLIKQWNNTSGQQKTLDHFFENKSTKEYVDVLVSELNLNTRNSVYLKTRGKNGGTWMNPYLFIDFAMWLNPKFKLQVIKFVHDQLIEYRHSAGDLYIGLTSSAARFKDVNYSDIAKALNWIVFNRHEKGIRQGATPLQLKEMVDIQKQLEFAIDMGYIKSFNQLLEEMRRIWHKKYASLTA
jgi:hypothetical protein